MTPLETALCLSGTLGLFLVSLAASWSWLARTRLIVVGLALWLLPSLWAAWKGVGR